MVCLLPDTPFGTLPSLDHGIFPRICTFKCLSKSKLLGEMYSSSCDKHHLEKFRVFHGSGQFSRVGSGRVGSGRVGSGRVGSGRVWLGWVGLGGIGLGRVGLGLSCVPPLHLVDDSSTYPRAPIPSESCSSVLGDIYTKHAGCPFRMRIARLSSHAAALCLSIGIYGGQPDI